MEEASRTGSRYGTVITALEGTPKEGRVTQVDWIVLPRLAAPLAAEANVLNNRGTNYLHSDPQGVVWEALCPSKRSYLLYLYMASTPSLEQKALENL